MTPDDLREKVARACYYAPYPYSPHPHGDWETTPFKDREYLRADAAIAVMRGEIDKAYSKGYDQAICDDMDRTDEEIEAERDTLKARLAKCREALDRIAGIPWRLNYRTPDIDMMQDIAREALTPTQDGAQATT